MLALALVLAAKPHVSRFRSYFDCKDAAPWGDCQELNFIWWECQDSWCGPECTRLWCWDVLMTLPTEGGRWDARGKVKNIYILQHVADNIHIHTVKNRPVDWFFSVLSNKYSYFLVFLIRCPLLVGVSISNGPTLVFSGVPMRWIKLLCGICL